MKKVILITGISSGIGKAFLEIGPDELQDYTFIGLTRGVESQQALHNVELIKTDITDTATLPKIVKDIVQKYGTIDVLINNAGSGMRGTIEDTTLEEVESQLSVNLWPALSLIRLVSPIMRKQKSGHIINISSLSATIDYPTIGYYGAIKAFIEKVTTTLATELKPWNVSVSLVVPGAVKTRFGRSMSNVKSYSKSPYDNLYAAWGRKFEAMFRKPTTSEQAAQKIVELILRPKSYTFFRFKDVRDYTLRRIFGTRVFTKLFLNRHIRG